MPDHDGSPDQPAAAQPATPRPSVAGADDQPVLPVRSSDDSDTGWGERYEPDADDRLREDRPPHWDAR